MTKILNNAYFLKGHIMTHLIEKPLLTHILPSSIHDHYSLSQTHRTFVSNIALFVSALVLESTIIR